MAKVVVYTKDYCPFCTRAKALLSDRGITFEEVDVSSWPHEKVIELFTKSKMRTVPQIYADDQLIGGFNELAERDRTKGLDDLK